MRTGEEVRLSTPESSVVLPQVKRATPVCGSMQITRTAFALLTESASLAAFSAKDCLDIMAETGADIVMIARGAEGWPMIFAECLALEAGKPLPEYSSRELLDVMRRHAHLTCRLKAESRAMPELRKHMLWYLGRLKGAKAFKPRMAQVSTLEEFNALCDEMEQQGFEIKG